MMLPEKINILWIRIITTFLFFGLLLLIIHTQVDLQPNRISIQADIPMGYSSPRIRFDNLETTYFFGQTLPRALTQFQSIQFEFSRQSLLPSEKFLLIDQSIIDEIENTVWTTAFPAGELIPSNTQGLILTSICEQAQFKLSVGNINWPIHRSEWDHSLLIASNPQLSATAADLIHVTVAKPAEHSLNDIRRSKPCFGAITILKTDQPLRIQKIIVDKTFGRLGLTIPLTTWNAEEISTLFTPIHPEASVWVEDGILMLDPGESLQSNLLYLGSLTELGQEMAAKTTKYLLALNLFAILLSGIFYLGFGVVLNFIMNQRSRIKHVTQVFLDKLKNGDENLLRGKPIILERTKLTALILLLVAIVFVIQELLLMRLGIISFILFTLLGILWVILQDQFADGQPLRRVKQAAVNIKSLHLLVVMILLGFGIFNLFAGLGTDNFYEDEFQVIDTAGGLLKTGDYYRWDWPNNEITTFDSHNSYAARYYTRAWPHTFLVAQSFNIFGISEWSARFVSVLFGVIFFISLYFFTRYFTNNHIAILVLFAAVFYPSFLGVFRYTRMYALLVPLFIMLAYTLYRAITGEAWPRTGIRKWDHLVGEYLNYDYRYAILSLLLLLISYIIHVNSLVILLAALVFVCLMAMIEKKKKYIILSVIGTIVSFVVIPVLIILQSSDNLMVNFGLLPNILSYVSVIGQRNYFYLTFLLRYPFGVMAGVLFFGVFTYFIYHQRKSSQDLSKYLYLAVIPIVSALFFVFVADRYIHFLYISHVSPFFIVAILGGFWHLSNFFFEQKYLLTAFCALMVLSYYITVPAILFEGQAQFGDYQTAYQAIIENYDRDQEVIYGQYLRTYYLRDLDGIEQISLLNNQRYSFNHFMQDLKQYPSGWLTWETRKSYHVDEQIIRFAERYFRKHHGTGVDNTGIEVYYFSLPEISINQNDW